MKKHSNRKKPKLFISHSSKDKEITLLIIKLLESIGFNNRNLFCSSSEKYRIPIDKDIYDYIKKQFTNYNLHILVILSDNYYSSIPSQNELGAAWVLGNKKTTILLPDFDYKDIKGVLRNSIIGIKLDDESFESRINELKDILIKEFKLKKINNKKWNETLIQIKEFCDKSKNTTSNKEEYIIKVNRAGLGKKANDLADAIEREQETKVLIHKEYNNNYIRIGRFDYKFNNPNEEQLYEQAIKELRTNVLNNLIYAYGGEEEFEISKTLKNNNKSYSTTLTIENTNEAIEKQIEEHLNKSTATKGDIDKMFGNDLQN